MDKKPLALNGVNGSTGDYLLPGVTTRQIHDIARGRPPSAEPGLIATLLKWVQRFAERYRPVEGVSPDALEEAGWGVLFPAADDAGSVKRQEAIREALRPLLDLRRAQAGKVRELFYREFTGKDGYRPGESKRDWLGRQRAVPGNPANPEKVPYYLLIVADPETVPFRFQYQIDVEYGVGRLDFETVEEYARYAQSVIDAEARGAAGARPRSAAFFGVRNPEDASTQLSADQLVQPLAGTFANRLSANGWGVTTALAGEATKARLGRLLGGDETTGFLFTASHGMGFTNGDPRQLAHQGALLCQDWPGPLRWGRTRPIPPDHYFSADDVGDDARVHGLIAFHFACYGAGTPRLDDYPDAALGPRDQVAPHAFLARLPRRLLAHPKGGALAVIGHVERAWGCSFVWPGVGRQLETFEGTLSRLLLGRPVGWATEPIGDRYAALAVELNGELEDEAQGKAKDDDLVAGLWTANSDARSYVVLGDPAVRLAVAPAPAAVAGSEPPLLSR
jgi:hypothetical protein